ncbi:MAG: hypothetical protein CL670_01265 [Balneola sp.]|jgi:hypothetical protein|nr:hypothetical protein [Balneola sp.]MBE77763.1 hypothetical protein [Balneola sp.]HBX65643.1 hypothetical protein [Balneolaceae bacterium]|tara:strand:- start:21359 stop:22087 length:729 start_codon:yes stop_codon:yes gene_type:complete
MNKALIKFSLLTALCLIPIWATAQMFSVGNEAERRANPFAPFLRVGVLPIDFSFTGDPSALSNGSSLAFSGTTAHLAFEQGGFNLGVSMGGDFSGLDDRKYFDLSLEFTNPFYFIRRPNFGAGVPIQLGTKLTSVRSDAISDEFSQTNLSAGAGAIVRFITPEKFGITTKFIPSVGFSTASGGLIGGNVFSMKGKARIDFYNLIFSKNISIGYDYIFDSYNIDGQEYDYDLSGHAITLGISL